MPIVDPIVFSFGGAELREKLIRGTGFPRRRGTATSATAFPTIAGSPRITPATLPGKPALTSFHISEVQRGAFFVESIEAEVPSTCTDMPQFIDMNFRGTSAAVFASEAAFTDPDARAALQRGHSEKFSMCVSNFIGVGEASASAISSVQVRRDNLPHLSAFLAPAQLCLNKQTGKVRVFTCTAATFGPSRLAFDDERAFRRPVQRPANDAMIPVMCSVRTVLPDRPITSDEIAQITGVLSVDGDAFAELVIVERPDDVVPPAADDPLYKFVVGESNGPDFVTALITRGAINGVPSPPHNNQPRPP